MKTKEQRDLFVAWREVFNTLRRDHTSHETRRNMMIVVYRAIERECLKYPETDFENACIGLMKMLTEITADESLTHSGVKAGLLLLEKICDRKVADWYDPKLAVWDIPF